MLFEKKIVKWAPKSFLQTPPPSLQLQVVPRSLFHSFYFRTLPLVCWGASMFLKGGLRATKSL